VGLIIAGIAVTIVAAIGLWDGALGVLIFFGPPAAGVLLGVRYVTADADERRLGWAVAGAVLVALTLGTIAVARHGVRRIDAEAALRRDGIPALAEVRSVRTTGRHMDVRPELLLELELTPERGSPYRVERKLYASPAAIPRPGDVLNAVVDPRDPGRWLLDLESAQRRGDRIRA
jgi:hypothetical protein